MCTWDLPDIYVRALGLGHIYQANPFYQCYNYYIYIYIYIVIYDKAQIQLDTGRKLLSLTRMHAVCSLRVGIKEGFLLATDTAE